MLPQDPHHDLDSLAEKIRAAKENADPSKAANQKHGQGGTTAQERDNMGKGMRAGLELVASIAAGTLIGLWLDKTFDTKPLFLIALFFLGVITGFVNIWRITNDVGYAVGYKNVNDHEAEKISAETVHENKDDRPL